MFLVVDCRDSFVYNLVACLESAGADVTVVKEADGVPSRRDVEALVLSPGPGRPSPDRGSWKAFERFRGEVPVLGVCLGHQTIYASYGASVVRRGGPRHGKVTDIRHDGKGILEGVPDPFHAVRYNSLCADPDTLEHPLEVDAVDGYGDIMAVSDREISVYGLQFHPESFLTEHGQDIVGNFVREVERWNV